MPGGFLWTSPQSNVDPSYPDSHLRSWNVTAVRHLSGQMPVVRIGQKLSEGGGQINDSSRLQCKVAANHSTDPRTTLDCVLAGIYESRNVIYDVVIPMISRNERGGGLLSLPKVYIPTAVNNH